MTARRQDRVGRCDADLLNEITVPVVRAGTAAHRDACNAVPSLYVVRQGHTSTLTAYWTDRLSDSPNARNAREDDPRVGEWWQTFGMLCVAEEFCRWITGSPFDCVVLGARTARAAQLIGATFEEFWRGNPDNIPCALAWLRQYATPPRRWHRPSLGRRMTLLLPWSPCNVTVH